MLDFLAIGAHADDIEIGMGATIAKLVAMGRAGALLDLSDASMGTRGTPAQRLEEASAAAGILGIAIRRNLGLRDGFLQPHEPDAVRRLVEVLRDLRPRVLFTHPLRDRHPDHEACAALVREACFKSGLQRFPAAGSPWRPKRIFHWLGARDGEPDFCVDVTEFWEIRRAALEAYPTQFASLPGMPQTAISGISFQEVLDARARHLGSRIRTVLAEGFTCEEIPEVLDPCALSEREF
jgi:N-acetylglucosamine malate deacetylase 1